MIGLCLNILGPVFDVTTTNGPFTKNLKGDLDNDLEKDKLLTLVQVKQLCVVETKDYFITDLFNVSAVIN